MFYLKVLPFVLGDSTILLNLSPEEAQKYIDGSSDILKYAPSLGGPGPLSSEKKAYFRGDLIEHPEEFIEETYNANQFHGQVNATQTYQIIFN